MLKLRSFYAVYFWLCWLSVSHAVAQAPAVTVSNVRRVYHNGEHNAFTDMIRFQERFYLTFRSCPDGHMVHPTSSIRVLASDDLGKWREVFSFSVPLRDTRDPHFLEFNSQLFVFTGTWYSGETTLPRNEYDLNKHLGYAVSSADGVQWSAPRMLEGTFGHYIWRASTYGGKAYLCGRRKHEFDVRPRGEGPQVESAMLVSEDGWVWKTHSLFQEIHGDETAFQFDADGSLLAVARRGSDRAELLRSQPPFKQFEHTDLDRYIGGPLLTRWGDRWLVGGRKTVGGEPKTSLYWLVDGRLIEFAELPSGGDNSYPGFVALDDNHAVVSWYSSHEQTEQGNRITAIYMADLSIDQTGDVALPLRQQIEFPSSADGSTQAAYLTVPNGLGSSPSAGNVKVPMVVSLHSWSADLQQRQPDLERLVAERGWFCLQPNFRGINDDPLACASSAAQADILDAVEWVASHYPIDTQNIFLTGNSGGGHMTMMMAAKYPERWRAASAWVGISDLASWHDRHRDDHYGEMTRQVCGGPPGASEAIDNQYRLRSPLTFLANAAGFPLDIAAGIHDGHTGSVPVRHSLEAFNTIAQAVGAEQISEVEMEQLSRKNGRLQSPQPQDEGFDDSFNRQIHLRRLAGPARVSLFEGGHEGIASAAMAWFERHLQSRPEQTQP